ncbi:hypothetical protein GCM10009799_07100 [Nocardiopsis rhodophaea]|uniref:Integral membrane protein n=1 Tax=Nocardiopsis rhodophaea TaxID=280238 RepID=A0ABN2SCE3_9ACTN
MIGGLTATIEIASLAIAVWTLISTFRNRSMDTWHLIGMGLLWLLLLGQAVVSVVLMVGGERPAEMATFVAYLATVVLIPPACALWGLMERTRWGPAVIAFACLILPVMMVRLEQIWDPSLV